MGLDEGASTFRAGGNQVAIIMACLQQQGVQQRRQMAQPRLQDMTFTGTARKTAIQQDTDSCRCDTDRHLGCVAVEPARIFGSDASRFDSHTRPARRQATRRFGLLMPARTRRGQGRAVPRRHRRIADDFQRRTQAHRLNLRLALRPSGIRTKPHAEATSAILDRYRHTERCPHNGLSKLTPYTLTIVFSLYIFPPPRLP